MSELVQKKEKKYICNVEELNLDNSYCGEFATLGLGKQFFKNRHLIFNYSSDEKHKPEIVITNFFKIVSESKFTSSYSFYIILVLIIVIIVGIIGYIIY